MIENGGYKLTYLFEKNQNLKESMLMYEVGKYKFYFSALAHYKKFKENHEKELSLFNERFNNAYRNSYNLSFDDLALIRYYYKTEKYGFYIEIDGVGVDCLNKIEFKSEVKVVS